MELSLNEVRCRCRLKEEPSCSDETSGDATKSLEKMKVIYTNLRGSVVQPSFLRHECLHTAVALPS